MKGLQAPRKSESCTSSDVLGESQARSTDKILVTGASGDIGLAVLELLGCRAVKLGAHYHRNNTIEPLLDNNRIGNAEVKLFAADLTTKNTCHALVDAFVDWAGGIGALVQLSGDVRRPISWESLSQDEWLADLNVNLSGPFFLCQRAMQHMKVRGGRIILTSTASARYGGAAKSMAYGVAKAGVECLTKGLAREGAPHGVLVNAVAPGFIETRFHTKRMARTPEELTKRAALVPLKRAGKPADIANLIGYLLSPAANFITGECIAVSGGDWL